MRTSRRARAIIGREAFPYEIERGETVDSQLARLSERHDIDQRECVLMGNGRHARTIAGGAPPLADGDIVSITVDPVAD